MFLTIFIIVVKLAKMLRINKVVIIRQSKFVFMRNTKKDISPLKRKEN